MYDPDQTSLTSSLGPSTGYGLKDCTWEPVSKLGTAAGAVNDFYGMHGKPSAKKRGIYSAEGTAFLKQFGSDK
ncbi:hypothetical protein BV898_05129 [Hypsibius exemplaris]|uniref:Uncharacterized protein n=1 Tax=Hypsibius exemplaris TaxID=2072580 RepID=A0A1W0X0T3_HYPEX|nr:hypothetical protein BV898_05129 [Hypsibius exemplaris]